MEDIDQNVFNLFSELIRDLSKTFPEIKACLYRNYEKELLNNNLKIKDSQKIQDFLKKIDDNKVMIENKDETLIQNDIQFLEEISFNRLWEKNISENTKNTIWKYLQTFVIININLKSNQDLHKALESIGESKKIKKKTAKELQTLKKLTEDIQKDNSSNVTENENELEDMVSGMMNSDIGNLAKEVASTINIEEMFGNVNENSNPMDLFSSIMQPDKMNNIFQNINTIVEKKIEKGELDKDNLKNQAENMFGTMSKNPMFNSVMKEMNPENNSSEELSKEEKKRRLKEKLNQKKKERTNN